MPPATDLTTRLIAEVTRELLRPFPAALVEFRPSGGGPVAYLSAWAVMQRLDEVAPGWQVAYREVPGGIEATITIAGVSRADVGCNDSVGELGVKGAYADALKRAAHAWGIGRFLRAYTPPKVSSQPHDLPPTERQRRDLAAWCAKPETIAMFGTPWGVSPVAGDPAPLASEGVAPEAPSGVPSLAHLRAYADAIDASGYYTREALRAKIDEAGLDAKAPGFWDDADRAAVLAVLDAVRDEAAAFGVEIEVPA